MAHTSALNEQIVDSVAATKFINVGGAPASSQALLDAVMSETLGMAMHNAVMRQQANSVVGSAATTATCARILQQGTGMPPSDQFRAPPPKPVIPPLDGNDDIDAGLAIAKATAKAGAAIDTLETQAEGSRAEASTAQTALDALNAKLSSLIGKPRPNS